MYCLKCGTKIPDAQVFCDTCLQVMEKYPVKPDSAVHIPQRKPRTAEKKPSRKKERSPEQTTQHSKSVIRWLLLTIAVLTVGLCLLGWQLVVAYGGWLPTF